jgi:hypothetical protein
VALLEIFGWLGAFFTLGAYSMRNMLPLRCVALGANVAFIIYGAFVPVYPVMVLHLTLLPLNLYRLWEILIGMRRKCDVTARDIAFDFLKPSPRPRDFSEGDVVFRRGDRPDHVYFLEEGRVELPELGETLGDGTLFGEMEHLTDVRERTTSAICRTDCRIVTIDEKSFTAICRQHPEFVHFILRLIGQRRADGSERNPELCQVFVEEAEPRQSSGRETV